jgi:hypothetical protein
MADVNVREVIWLGQRVVQAGRADIRQLAPGVPTAELIVMYDLLDHGPSTITELAERTGYAQSLLAELPAPRRDAIIGALTDLHDYLRQHGDETAPERDSTQEVHRLLSPQQ